jgi:hypothetical protein
MRMRRTFLVLFLAACGGPTQQQIVESPAATAPHPHTEAPPASTSDADRSRLIQQFDDMRWTQQAYEQAGQENQAPPAPPPTGQPTAPGQPAAGQPPPKKRGVAEQATLPK